MKTWKRDNLVLCGDCMGKAEGVFDLSRWYLAGSFEECHVCGKSFADWVEKTTPHDRVRETIQWHRREKDRVLVEQFLATLEGVK